jgi:hypothetical protein
MPKQLLQNKDPHMQTHKNILLLIGMLFTSQAMASTQSLPLPDLSEGLALGVGSIATYVGLFQVARGAYTFFTSGDTSLTSKTLTDYEKKELLAMPKDKLAKIVAREDERSKATMASFETFLNGMIWFSIAGASGLYTKEYILKLAQATANQP